MPETTGFAQPPPDAGYRLGRLSDGVDDDRRRRVHNSTSAAASPPTSPSAGAQEAEAPDGGAIGTVGLSLTENDSFDERGNEWALTHGRGVRFSPWVLCVTGQRLSLARFVGRVAALYALYLVANITAVVALCHLPAVVCSAIFSAATPFVCVMSWVALNRRGSYLLDSLATVMAVVGILLVTHPWTAQSDAKISATAKIVYSVIAAVSPLAAATYKVLFAKLFVNVKWYKVGNILATLASVNLTIGLFLLYIAVFLTVDTSGSGLHVEPNPIARYSVVVQRGTSYAVVDEPLIPWTFAIVGSVCGTAFNFVLNFGVTVMPPLFVSIGTVLSTGLNVAAPYVIAWCNGDDAPWATIPSLLPVEWAGLSLVSMSVLVVVATVVYESSASGHSSSRKRRTAVWESTDDGGHPSASPPLPIQNEPGRAAGVPVPTPQYLREDATINHLTRHDDAIAAGDAAGVVGDHDVFARSRTSSVRLTTAPP